MPAGAVRGAEDGEHADKAGGDGTIEVCVKG